MNASLTNHLSSACGEKREEFVEENPHESTYAMLIRAEEKPRTALEILLYVLCVLSAVAAIWQFAQQPNALPLKSISTTVSATTQQGPTSCG
jgi:hypothetical protein